MIRFITDSTCEAPDELLSHPAVTVVPLYVLFGQESLRDNVDISREEFWKRLPSAKPLPTTSQVPPSGFLAPFREYTDAGDEVIALVISGKLSRTYDSAISAQSEIPDRPIEVVDSLTTSVCLGLLLQDGLRMAEAGKTRAEIVARLNALRSNVHLLFALETLEYLVRGGRIGRVQALAGALLHVKPLIAVDHHDGKYNTVARIRTLPRALHAIADHLFSIHGDTPLWVTVLHGRFAEQAGALVQELNTRLNVARIEILRIAPVLGVHTGPGIVGAAAVPAHLLEDLL